MRYALSLVLLLATAACTQKPAMRDYPYSDYNTTQFFDHWLSVKFENFKPVNYEIKKTATFGRLQGKSSH